MKTKIQKKSVELEKIVEWDFETFNNVSKDIFKINSMWQLIFFPFVLVWALIFYFLTYPFYVLHHLFNNREVYYKDRFWRLKE